MVVKEGHRQRQARATREQVATAARTVFAEHGYVATTITAIAEAADIPAATIYSAFGSKAAILAEVRRLWILGSEVHRAHAEGLSRADPAERLRLLAKWNARQLAEGLDVIQTYQEAARSDPDLLRTWREVLAGREAVTRDYLLTIEPHLRSGIDHAMDVFLALTQPDVYRTLVIERAWSTERFATWLGDLLVAQLLNPTTSGHRRSRITPEH